MGVGFFLEIIFNSAYVALASAGISIVLGIGGAIGLRSIADNKKLEFSKAIGMSTFFIPALFLIIGILNIITPFPFGFWGIIILHVLTVFPLASVLILDGMNRAFFGFERLAIIEGSTPSFFFRKSFYLLLPDLISIFLYLFVISLMSFSIPLIIGHNFPVFETAIYRSILEENGFLLAFIISLIEMFLVFFILSLIGRKINFENKILADNRGSFYLCQSKFGLILFFTPVLLFSLGILLSLQRGYSQLLALNITFHSLAEKTIKSISLSLVIGIGCIFLLSLVYRFYYKNKIQRFLYAAVIPSTAFIGMIFWLPPFLNIPKSIKFVLGFLFISLSTLIRMKTDAALRVLNRQILIAETMGATKSLIYRKIIFPQMIDSICFVSAIGAFWALGDFAFSTMIFGDDSTLSLFAKTLLNQYRLEAASVIVIYILFLGMVIYSLIRGIRYVVS